MTYFTVVGFYPDTLQRFSEWLEANNADEAELKCSEVFPGLAVCGIIAGCHACSETTNRVQVQS